MAAMATVHASALFFLVTVVPVTLSTAEATPRETRLNFFMHNIVFGDNPSAVRIVEGPAAATASSEAVSVGMSFGDVTVIDDLLTESCSTSSAAVGRVEGFFVVSSKSGPILTVSANLVLTAGDYSGNTIAIMGRLDDTPSAMDDASARELAVVGGTGMFRRATGHVLLKITSMDGPNAVIELDVYVTMARGAIEGTCSS